MSLPVQTSFPLNYSDPDSVPAIWQVGDVILDLYEVKEVFTGGGMGLVYRVHHRNWDMALAVKSPRPEFFQMVTHVENFEREAETWVNLGLHPHTVGCYYVRRLGGIPRLFAEFVDGGSLADWIRTKKLYDGGKDKALERIVDVAIQFAWGLQYAHEKGLVHQDVKPGNVLMSPDGTAKVSDFGLANARRFTGEKPTVAARPGQSILVPGSGFLTPEYASPEQLRGEGLSRKTDVWSWAVSLLEMLTGELTWASGLAAPYVLQDLYDGACSSDPLANLLERCLAQAPSDRPADLGKIGDELCRIYHTISGRRYARVEPEAVAFSSDTLNNHAVSLLDLGRLHVNHTTGRRGAYDAIAELEKLDRTHVDGMLNKILMRWRHSSAPIHEINRAIDNILVMPGVAGEVGADWLMAYELETLQTQRAIKTSASFRGENPQQLALIECPHRQIKTGLHGFFCGLTHRFRDETRRILEDEDEDCGSCSVSSTTSGFVCWAGWFDEGEERVNGVRIWRVSDDREVFRLTDVPARIHAAALSENGTSLVVLFLDERIEDKTFGGQLSIILGIYDVTKSRVEKIAPKMKISTGSIRLTVDDAGMSASIWIQPSNFGEWYQIKYTMDQANGDFRGYGDLRIASPIIWNQFICASGDGKRLLVAGESSVQLWETSAAYLGQCILELSLADFGLIDTGDHLPGFELDKGFEFGFDQWNIFDLLHELRLLSGARKAPYRIVKPQNIDEIQHEHAQLANLEQQIAVYEESHQAQKAASALDNCLRLRSAPKAPLIARRHRLIKAVKDLFVARCWHHRQIDEYWASNIMALESDAEGQTTLKRCRCVYTENGEGSRAGGEWDADERDGMDPYGFAELSNNRAIFLLAENSGEFQKSVALLDGNGKWGRLIKWELPLPQTDRSQMYDAVVLLGETLFIRRESTVISAHEIDSGSEKKVITLSDSISMMRRVVWKGSEAIAVGTKTTGNLYILNENAELVEELRADIGAQACIEDVSRCAESAVVLGTADSVWHVHLQTGKQTRICVRWDYPEDTWGWRPYFQRLSPCGRALADIFDGHLRVFDVRTRKRVLHWKIPPRELVPPCFDLSGRWLTLAHSANKREVFELMWDIA